MPFIIVDIIVIGNKVVPSNDFGLQIRMVSGNARINVSDDYVGGTCRHIPRLLCADLRDAPLVSVRVMLVVGGEHCVEGRVRFSVSYGAGRFKRLCCRFNVEAAALRGAKLICAR